MARKEHEHLSQYFYTPEVDRSLLETVMHDQVGFDPRMLPDNIIQGTKGIVDGTVLVLEIKSPPDQLNMFNSSLWVSVEELRKPIAIPEIIDQSVRFSLKGVRTKFTYRYTGPRSDSPGLLQQFRLELPVDVGSIIKGIDLTREVIDNIGDLRFASVWLLPEAENGIRQLLDLPINTAVGLLLVPGHVLVTQGGARVIAELRESDLQKIGINGRLDDDEDEMVANVASGPFSVTIKLGKRLECDYPSFMFGSSVQESARPVTPCKFGCGRFDESDLN